ncbi:copper-transporting ATPase, partial [Candidatus Thiomargarita nelsonii]
MLPIFLFSGYYFLAALVGVLYALTDKLITKIEDNTNKNLVDVFGQQARFVWILKDNIEIEIPFDALKNGDIVVVNAGESIPVDGTIIQGTASIDQHILTGESQPAEKGIGDQVLAVTVVIEGHIHVQAEKAGEQTVAAQIGQILTNTTDFREFVRLQGLEDANKMVPLRLLLTGLAL